MSKKGFVHVPESQSLKHIFLRECHEAGKSGELEKVVCCITLGLDAKTISEQGIGFHSIPWANKDKSLISLQMFTVPGVGKMNSVFASVENPLKVENIFNFWGPRQYHKKICQTWYQYETHEALG